MVGVRLSRFGSVAAATAVSALAGATSGCATFEVLTNPEAAARFAPAVSPAVAKAAPVERADLAARAAALTAELDRLPSFDPERVAAEPALVALAAKIAATMGEAVGAEDVDGFETAPIDLIPIADLAQPPAALVAQPPETPWAVELGQFDDADLAKTMWTEIAAAAPDVARGLSPRIIARADGVILRAGPLDDRELAATACAGFEAAGATCKPAQFAGKALMEPGG